MAWWAGSARARGWLVVVAGVGCTTPNPAYDEDGLATTASSDTGSGADTLGSATTRPSDTTQVGSGEAGSESGLASCEDPPLGVEVVVVPTNVPEPELCGFEDVRIGRFELSGGQYRLHLAPECMVGSPVPIVFSPKGPSLSEAMPRCVSFDIRYRPDCTFEAVTIREVENDALIFAAATNPASHIAELELALGDPAGDVCDCGSAACCDGSPPPGPYTVDASTSGGSVTLAQGEQTTFSSGNGMFELAVPRARATDDCERPVQVDWYYRQVSGG